MSLINRGDVVTVSLRKVGAGTKVLSAVVLSQSEFNELGDVLLAPITSDVENKRFAGFAVPLGRTTCNSIGSILVNKVRTVDRSVFAIEVRGRVTDVVLALALTRLAALTQ